MRILVTDDSAFLRKMTCGFIEGLGFETIQAKDGEECLKLLVEEKPDCLFLDLIMPNVDGFEVLKTLRKQQNMIPIFVLTADVQDVVRDECYALGAADFLNKPPKKEDIQRALETLFGRGNQS